MSAMTASRRARVTAQVEALGVVAVIRLKDPAKLRAVVDAIAEGGVRALEVTMTVPGAVGLIRGARADAARRVSARRRHRHRRRDGARGDRRRRAVRRQPGVPAARSIAACHERDVPAMPGCFTPTEILDGVRARRRHRQGVSGDGARPAVHQGRPRAAAAGEADADRRRDARQRRRLDPRRRGRGRRRLGAARRARRSRSGRFDVITAQRAPRRRERRRREMRSA